MTTTSPTSSSPVPRAPAPRPAAPTHAAGRIGYACAAFCAAYGTLALAWTVTGRGYPFGANDSDEKFAVLHHVPVAVGAPLFAVGLLAASVLALAASGPYATPPRGAARRALLAVGWAIGGALLVAVPTTTALALVAYAPMLLAGAPFGWPAGIDYRRLLDWSLLNQVLCLVGGVLLARTMLQWQRRTRGACPACGLDVDASARASTGLTAARAARLGRRAVGVAVVIPLVYAVTRYAWVLDVPLLISEQHLRELRAEGGQWVGAGIATFAVVGSLLTLGLVQRWGETFPRWIPWLGARPVPVALAVVPASLVAVLVLAGTLGPISSPEFWRRHPVEALPLAPMPLWAIALAVATYAYRVRRRGTCAGCRSQA